MKSTLGMAIMLAMANPEIHREVVRARKTEKRSIIPKGCRLYIFHQCGSFRMLDAPYYEDKDVKGSKFHCVASTARIAEKKYNNYCATKK